MTEKISYLQRKMFSQLEGTKMKITEKYNLYSTITQSLDRTYQAGLHSHNYCKLTDDKLTSNG